MIITVYSQHIHLKKWLFTYEKAKILYLYKTLKLRKFKEEVLHYDVRHLDFK